MNRKGIVYVWVVAAITICFTALVWFVVSYPMWIIVDVVESQYTYPTQSRALLNLVQSVLTWFLGFEVFGVLIWALVSSHRKGEPSFD
jgi:uncharacterized membrane protein (DUF373 family)